MQITLLIDGKEKTFSQPFVSGRILRKTIELEKEYAKMLEAAKDDIMKYDNEKELDLAVNYVVEAFSNQFTAEQFESSVPSHLLFDICAKIKEQVRTGRSEAIKPFADSVEKEEADPNA